MATATSLIYIFVISTCGLRLRRQNGQIITSNDLGPFRHQHHIKNILGETLYSTQTINPSLSSISITSSSETDFLINPLDYGADPTGKLDSTAAIEQALKTALSRGDASNHSLSDGIKDCGGATIFLAGGDYLISKSLVIPPYYGNIRITDGTLRANSNFSSNDFMIRVGGNDASECKTKQKSCNEYINIDHFFCDCSQQCFGCIHIVSGMSTNIGPQAFFLGYNGAGIEVSGGHSLYLQNAWFGEYLYSDPNKSNYAKSTATSIILSNPDNLISNVIVYSSRVGVNITGPASVLTAVHTWNLGTKSGGIGIVLSSHARLIECYLDYNDLVLMSPISLVSVQNTFFLGSGTLRLVTNGKDNVVNSLSVVGSLYNSGNGSVDTIVLDETKGKFTSVNNMIVKDAMILSGYNMKSTKVSKKMKKVMATEWKFDFSADLLFEGIDIEWMDYTLQFDGNQNDENKEIVHWVNKSENGVVVVETNEPTNATVYITVDQAKNYAY